MSPHCGTRSATAGDPRCAGLAASALPITQAGIWPAVALVLLVGHRRAVWTGCISVVMFAAVAGVTMPGLAALSRGTAPGFALVAMAAIRARA